MPALICLSLLVMIFVAIALIHIYWALGGQWGARAAIPELQGRVAFVPGKLATLLVALAFLAMSAGILLPYVLSDCFYNSLRSWVLVFISVVFLARAIGEFRLVGFFKRVRDTRFAKLDTLFYSPLCLGISLLAATCYYLLYWT